MNEAPFFCFTCHRRYVLDKDCLAKVDKSIIQKTAPFIDHEEKDKVIEKKFVDQKIIYKCPICGFTLKEIEYE